MPIELGTESSFDSARVVAYDVAPSPAIGAGNQAHFLVAAKLGSPDDGIKIAVCHTEINDGALQVFFDDIFESDRFVNDVAITPIRNGNVEITFFAFVDAEKRVILQAFNVSPTGTISRHFTLDTGILADEVKLHPAGDRLVMIGRQGTSVVISLWAFNFSTAQMSVQSLLRTGLSDIGHFTGSNLDMNYTAAISDLGFRTESLVRTAGNDWQSLGSAIATSGGRLLCADAFGTSPGDDDFRRAAILTASEGPTAVWSGWLLFVNRLLVHGGTLSLSLYGADVNGGVQNAPLKEEARVDLEGWFGIAHEAAMLSRPSDREFVTAHTGHQTWRRFSPSDRGRRVMRVIFWALTGPASAGFGEHEIERLESRDIEGTFSSPRLIAPLGEAMVLTALNEQGQLVFRPITVSRS